MQLVNKTWYKNNQKLTDMVVLHQYLHRVSFVCTYLYCELENVLMADWPTCDLISFNGIIDKYTCNFVKKMG